MDVLLQVRPQLFLTWKSSTGVPETCTDPWDFENLPHTKLSAPPHLRKEQGMEKARGKRSTFNLYSTSPVSCETLRRY